MEHKEKWEGIIPIEEVKRGDIVEDFRKGEGVVLSIMAGIGYPVLVRLKYQGQECQYTLDGRYSNLDIYPSLRIIKRPSTS